MTLPTTRQRWPNNPSTPVHPEPPPPRVRTASSCQGGAHPNQASKGTLGEERLGRRLNELASGSLHVLHDRGIPKSKGEHRPPRHHPTGVYAIDAKKYKGRPRLRVEGGPLRPRVERLLGGTRDCTKLVDGVRKQVAIVRASVGNDVPVHGVLCFVEPTGH
jgi:hypothetical protein